MEITDDFLRSYISMEPEIITETVAPVQLENPMISDCKDIIFKLTSYQSFSSDEPSYDLGIETGMQRAADMIQNMINRHENKDYNG